MAAASGDHQSVHKVPKPALLLLVGEPHTEDHKDLIIQRVIKELTSWDDSQSGLDLDAELQAFLANIPPTEDSQYGDKVINYESEKASITVVLNPNARSLSIRLRSFLVLPGAYHHVIYSGLAIRGSGCWLIQDGFYTASAFSDLLRCSEISSAVKQGVISGTIALSVFAGGEWSENILSRAVSAPLTLQVNREPSVAATSGLIQFCDYLSGLVKVVKLAELLPASGVVGNIRFSRPTIYIFPGGQGDSALFGVSGFNLLLDGGYMRRSCFWDFTRHLDRIDALLITHVGADNLFGLSSVAERKARDAVHPEIGHIYMNAIETSVRSSDCSASDKGTSLLVNLADEASLLVESLKKSGLVLNKCLAGAPSAAGLPAINLYHKVGHGSLDLYALTPSTDSKVLKEFFAQWNRQGNGFKAHGGSIPLSNQSSVCALLVWKPSSPTDLVTRILFPGTAPQSAILDALDKMKSMTIFQHAVYTEKDSSSKSVSGGVTKKQPAKYAAPVTTQKPTSLPMSAKSDKVEHKDNKKPQSAPSRAIKEVGKIHSPAKPIVKDIKVAEIQPSHPPSEVQSHAESPTESQNSEPKVVRETLSPESSAHTEEKFESQLKMSDSSEGNVISSPLNEVSLEMQTAEQDESVSNYIIGDLQAVPEPNLPLEDFGILVQERSDSDLDSHFIQESTTPCSSEGTTEFKEVVIERSSGFESTAAQSDNACKESDKPVLEGWSEETAQSDNACKKSEKPVLEGWSDETAQSDNACKESDKPVLEGWSEETAQSDNACKESDKPVLEGWSEETAQSDNACKESDKPVLEGWSEETAQSDNACKESDKPILERWSDETAGTVEETAPSDNRVMGDLEQDNITDMDNSYSKTKMESFQVSDNSFVTGDTRADLDLVGGTFSEVTPVTSDDGKSTEAATMEISYVKENLDDDKDIDTAEESENRPLNDCQGTVSKSVDNEESMDPVSTNPSVDDSETINQCVDQHIDTAEESNEPVSTNIMVDDSETMNQCVEKHIDTAEESIDPVSTNIMVDDSETMNQCVEKHIDTAEESIDPVSTNILIDDNQTICNFVDKDINTAEESVDPESTVPVDDNQTVNDSVGNFSEFNLPKDDDYESSKLMQLPPDVVANSLLRSDSLDAGKASRADSSENIDTEYSEADDNLSANPSVQADLFNMSDLKSVQDEPVNTNPFFGITETVNQPASEELFGACKQADDASHNLHESALTNPFGVVQPDGFTTSETSNAVSANPFAFEEHQHLYEGRLERDSLEREISHPHHFGGDEFDPLKEWDQPLGLPAPNKLPGAKAEPTSDKKSDGKKTTSPTKPLAKQPQATGSKYQAKKDDKDEVEGPGGESKSSTVSSTKKPKTAAVSSEGTSKSSSARSQVGKKPVVGVVPIKAQLKPVVPFYVDLAYIPGHGMTEYVDLEFFRRVRARYYVLSTVSPDPATLGALVEAKSTWDDPDVPVTIIPTYDAEVLRYWMAAHRDQLSQLRIDVAPAANRCTIQLQDHDAGCAAFRLEF